MNIDRQSMTASGEISDENRDAAMVEIGAERVRVDPEQEKMTAELQETEAELAKAEAEIRKLEAAAKAPLTEGERKEYEAVITKAAQQAETLGYAGQKATDFIDASKKLYKEGREGISAKLKRRQQDKDYLEGRKAELNQKLRGEQPS